MSTWAIVVAAGRGERLGHAEPKAFVPLHGRPMLSYSLRALEATSAIEGALLVVPPGWEAHALEVAGREAGSLIALAAGGGETRQDSVRAALRALDGRAEQLVVHDAARPLVTPELFVRSLDALNAADAAVCAVPVRDTLKRSAGGRVMETASRDDLWRAQTPQAFRADALRRAHERAAREKTAATDDAALVEADGGVVVLVAGDERNLKVTTKADLELADALLAGSRPVRTGTGYDAHAFEEGRALVLGGVELPSDRGLAGHSDADVLCHAVCDALLGAAALGDLGTHFPSNDRRWADVTGTELLRRVSRMLRDSGYEVLSVDATLILQRPAVAPYREEMRARIARALGIGSDAVSVKATTTDGLGVTGRGEGAAAQAVALLSGAAG